VSRNSIRVFDNCETLSDDSAMSGNSSMLSIVRLSTAGKAAVPAAGDLTTAAELDTHDGTVGHEPTFD